MELRQYEQPISALEKEQNNMIRIKYKLITLLFFGLFFWIQTSNAQLEIVIGEGNIRGIPTAVVPFKFIDASSETFRIDEVIGFNLSATGKFEVIPKSNYLTFPSRLEEVRFKDWRLIDAEILVIGEIWKIAEDQYEVQFRIFDVARQTEIGSGKRIPNLRQKDLRTSGHIVSDHIYTAFTNQPGAFNSRIAYVQKTKIDAQRSRHRIMIADWDGHNAQEVYASWRPLISPSWSPDLRKLAFVSFEQSGSVVKILELTTGQFEIIAEFKGINSAPSWSPEGRKLAYSTSRRGNPDVFIYDTETRQHQQISKHYAIDTEPSWSVDGRSLLFTSNRNGKPQIYRASINGGAANRVTFEGDENANASYDFAGKRLTMVHEGGEIIVMDTETGKITWLTNSKLDESPSFSPNGDMVLYATEQNYTPTLMVASADGRVRTQLEAVSGDVREPSWSPLRK